MRQAVLSDHLYASFSDKIQWGGGHKALSFSNTLVENIKQMKQKWGDMTLLIECHGSFALLSPNVTLKSRAHYSVWYVAYKYLALNLAMLIF